jgi:hypothetical protein
MKTSPRAAEERERVGRERELIAEEERAEARRWVT